MPEIVAKSAHFSNYERFVENDRHFTDFLVWYKVS